MNHAVTVNVEDLTAQVAGKESILAAAPLWIKLMSKNGGVTIDFYGTGSTQLARLLSFQASLDAAIQEMRVLLRLRGEVLPSPNPPEPVDDTPDDGPDDDIPF